MERDLTEREPTRLSPYAISRWRGNSLCSVTALRFGLGGPVLSLNAASATGAQILWMAGNMIRAGMTDAVVAVAADPGLPPVLSAAMSRNGSVAKGGDSLPLSASRSGMNPAEGAACLILESSDHAISRGAKPLAEWFGGDCRNEAHHLQAPAQDGGVLREMLQGMRRDAEQDGGIDWISLHATGTPRYDAVEASVLESVFGDRMPRLSAFKRTTGHALSASGLLEALLLCEGLSRGCYPPEPTEIDSALGLALGGEKLSKSPKRALQIAQGMGGDVIVNLMGLPGL